jgi:hypothetical protein
MKERHDRAEGLNEFASSPVILAHFFLWGDYSVEEIEEVFRFDQELKSAVLPKSSALDTSQLAAIIKDLITKADEEFGDFPKDDTLVDRVKAQAIDRDPSFEEVQNTFDAAHHALKSDRRCFRLLDHQELAEFVKHPIWSFEQFAAFSLGVRRSLSKMDATGPQAIEFERRLRFMHAANKLPATHPQHLRSISTPAELVHWATAGSHFDLNPMMVFIFQRPNYDELAAKLREAEALISAHELQNSTQRRPEDDEKQKTSLQRICIMLLACMGEIRPRTQKQLFDPRIPRTDLFSNIMTRVHDVLDPDDIVSDDTLRNHLKAAYGGLEEQSKKKWLGHLDGPAKSKR